jgi:hypothetical protein
MFHYFYKRFITTSCFGDQLWAFWAQPNNSPPRIVGKKWTQLNGWDAGLTVISMPQHDALVCQTIPNSTALGYIPIWYHDDKTSGGTNYLYFRKLTTTCDNAGYNYLISSLPFTVTTAMNNSVIGVDCNADSADLSSLTNGIVVNTDVHDVTIDLRGRTLYYGQGTPAPIGNPSFSDVAFKAMEGNYNITVRNGTLYHDLQQVYLNDPHFAVWAAGVRIAGTPTKPCHDINFENVRLIVKGRNTRAIVVQGNATSPTVYNLDFYGMRIWDSCFAYARRDYWVQQSLFAADYLDRTYPGMDYHFQIRACSTSSFWSGIFMNGDSTVAKVFDNYIMTDARNDLQADTSGSAMTTATECYAIAIHQGSHTGPREGVRIKVYNNTIRSGDNYAGGRGIFVTSSEGMSLTSSDSCIYIYNNDINVHQGYDGNNDNLMGIIAREYWRNVWIESNKVTISGDQDAGTSNYGEFGAGIRVGANGDIAGLEEGLRIVRNHVEGGMIGNWTIGQDPSGPVYMAGLVFDAFCTDGANIRIDSNYFGTDGCPVVFGFYNGCGGLGDNQNGLDNIHQMYADTIAGYGGSVAYTWMTGRTCKLTCNGMGNHPLDPIFISPATYNSVYFNGADNDSFAVGVKATLDITIKDSSLNPINGAIVTAVNGYGNTVLTDTTNTSGKAGGAVVHWWASNGKSGMADDSTGYNNFTITAVSGENNGSGILTVSPTSKAITILLAGGGPPPQPGARRLLKGIHR